MPFDFFLPISRELELVKDAKFAQGILESRSSPQEQAMISSQNRYGTTPKTPFHPSISAHNKLQHTSTHNPADPFTMQDDEGHGVRNREDREGESDQEDGSERGGGKSHEFNLSIRRQELLKRKLQDQ